MHVETEHNLSHPVMPPQAPSTFVVAVFLPLSAGTWAQLIRLGWLARGPQGDFCLGLLSSGITAPGLLIWVLNQHINPGAYASSTL